MKASRQKRIPVNVSLPVDFYMHIEDIWQGKWNQGHTVLRFREFVSELISMGFQVWEERNPEPHGLALVKRPLETGEEWGDMEEAHV
jgi:hypothetical protein